MLMMKGMPFCSATWAIAVDCPESKAPTSSCAPSLISRSARERATSALDSVSPFMMARSGSPRSLRMPAVISTPRWQSWPMPACTPERGSSTPTFRPRALGAADAERAGPGEQPAAPAPAANVRRDRRLGLERLVLRICGHCRPPLGGPFGPHRAVFSARDERCLFRPAKVFDIARRLCNYCCLEQQMRQQRDRVCPRGGATVPAPAASEDGAVGRHADAPARASGGRRSTSACWTGHLGYSVRRLQVWIFQDFVRTLAAFDIRPAQYLRAGRDRGQPGPVASRPRRRRWASSAPAGAPAGRARAARPDAAPALPHRPALARASSDARRAAGPEAHQGARGEA